MNEFRVLLLDIAQHLRKDDLEHLKFACSTFIPAGRAEFISRPHELFLELEKMGKLSESDREFLAVILVKIGRNDLRNKLLGIPERPLYEERPHTQATARRQHQLEPFKQRVSTDIILEIAEKTSTSWKFLGRHLKVPEHTLSNIDDTYKKTEEKGYAMLKKWSETSATPTVLVLLRALDKCGRRDLAEIIEEKFGPNVNVPGQRQFPNMRDLEDNLPDIADAGYPIAQHGDTARQGRTEQHVFKQQDDTVPTEIVARGAEAQKAYEEALKSGKTKNPRLLVMVVGPARAGKTSLLKSLNGEEFDPKEDSTDGIQLQRTFCKSQENCWSKESDKGISYADCMADIIHKNLQGGDDSEEIHDENFEKESVESSKSLLKNDDDDRDEDHDDVDNANDDDDAHGHDDDKMNAIKVESEETDEEANEELEVKEYISEKSTAILPKFIEEKVIFKLRDTKLSDKTNRENEVYIKSLDFAGQAVYNVIHPIFLTSKAVFILVYNLKNIPHHLMKSIVEEDGAERELVDPFEMTNMENLELWLSCISSYTDAQRMAKIGELSLPPVFIAGTHADKFDGNLEDAKEIIRKIYKSLSPSKRPSGCHVVRNQIYTVNNRVSGNGEINDKSVRELKADIEKLSKSLPHMDEDIPVNWLWFEEVLSNLVEKENKKYITIDEALKIANKCKVNTSAESKEFLTLLNYLHDLKTVIYFEETKKVFIDTEWLVKVFTKVIEVRPVEKRDGFDESWDKLEEKGVLDRALVEHVWKRLVDEQNTIDALLLIMEKFSLICRWNASEGEEVYLVPCMLCNSKKREDIAKCLEHEKSSTMVIRFNISHVALGIFPRLFVAIAEEGKKIWPNLRQPILHKNICRISKIGKERKLDICIIQSSFQTISVTVCNKQNIDGQRVTEFCQHFRKLLDQVFVDMCRNFPWMQNMTFEYGILCPVCTTSPNKCKSHEIEGCTRDTCLHFVNEEELSVDTPECEKDVANLDNVIEEKAYVYWFPRQVVGPTLDFTENQKRWLVISICLNIVLLPPLRKFLERNMLKHYTKLKTSYNIHNQVHEGRLVNDAGQALKYCSINNNGTKNVKDYDYNVTSAIDLAKLYLKSHMAQFTGFNDTCDLSAVLGVLSSASVFSADIQDFSSKVRKDVRNEWAHPNFQTWDETKFADSFNLMNSLLKALKLSSEDENTVADQLKEWENNCVEICIANTVPPELVKDIEDKVSQLSREFQLALRRNEENVAQLSEDVKHLAISQQEEVCRVLETLVTVQDAIRSLNQRMGLNEVDVEKVKEEVRKLKEEVKRAHERIDCIQK
ncbi:uncharacterized protein LOC116288602 [Actinia tenebrosa]|uniref:Uncharacterized protein LOC116288602 n=1 Tax=Actinia tenebrosa TaxID=6105 RepID=A0A6P8HF94_ACTTE|nr:uncharacterized protein LOC116288602 [Actinia tenebrosa]